MTIIAGQFTPQWGHTALAVGFGKLYALRSFPEGSSLCVFDMGVPMDGIMTPEDFVMLGEYHTPGKHSCHITLLDSQAVVCDYTSGTMSLFDLDGNGMPVGSPALIGFEGNGVNAIFQQGHGIFPAVELLTQLPSPQVTKRATQSQP